MSKYQEGEHIGLCGDRDDNFEYIKGWVELDDAATALESEFGDDREAISINHIYAFWGVGKDECGEPRQLFYTRDNPGRGRFKITEVSVRRI